MESHAVKKYKYLIFDFDGTLADTNLGIVKAYQETYRLMGMEIPSTERVTASIGLVLKDAVEAITPGLSKEKKELCMDLYRQSFPKVAYSVTKAFPGVLETLGELQKGGYRMSIATSRGHETLDRMAEMIGVRRFFDVMCGAEDVVNHKPSPDPVKFILGRLGLNPEEVLVIGDATYDILMGHAAGCDACGIAWGNMSKETLSTVAPEYLLDSISALKGILL